MLPAEKRTVEVECPRVADGADPGAVPRFCGDFSHPITGRSTDPGVHAKHAGVPSLWKLISGGDREDS